MKDLNQEIKQKQQAKVKKEQEKIDAFNASPVGMLLDENNVDDIVLFDSDNNPIKFQQVALIPYDKTGKLYAILIPLTPMVGVNPGEGVLFEIDEENIDLSIVRDDAIIDEVLEIYLKEIEDSEDEESDKN